MSWYAVVIVEIQGFSAACSAGVLVLVLTTEVDRLRGCSLKIHRVEIRVVDGKGVFVALTVPSATILIASKQIQF